MEWKKLDQPAIAHGPEGKPLTGFRDPFIIQKGGKGKPWRLIIGSGTKEHGGTILLYESNVPTHGEWRFCSAWKICNIEALCDRTVKQSSSAGLHPLGQNHVKCLGDFCSYLLYRPSDFHCQPRHQLLQTSSEMTQLQNLQRVEALRQTLSRSTSRFLQISQLRRVRTDLQYPM